jgi:hypothetical protein
MKAMKVLEGSSINADTLEIIIEDDSNVAFSQKYYYGYDVSYNKDWATEDKPLDINLINKIASEYNIQLSEIIYAEGTNVFKESLKERKV